MHGATRESLFNDGPLPTSPEGGEGDTLNVKLDERGGTVNVLMLKRVTPSPPSGEVGRGPVLFIYEEEYFYNNNLLGGYCA